MSTTCLGIDRSFRFKFRRNKGRGATATEMYSSKGGLVNLDLIFGSVRCSMYLLLLKERS